MKERLVVKYSREVEHTMAVEIKMPQLSDTMHDGKIIEWRVKEGQQVNRGDILAEVETDKANLEIECFHQGVLLKIMTPADQVAKVGQVIAVIGEQGDAAGTQLQPAPQTSVPVSSQAPTSAGTTAPVASVQPETVVHETYSNGNSQHAAATGYSDRVKASPLARKLAEERQIDLSSVRGSGPQGRIVKRDLESLEGVESTSSAHHQRSIQQTVQPSRDPQQSESSSQLETKAPIVNESKPAEGRLEKLSKMRETIARRMQESVQTTPHFYVTTSIRMDAVQTLRAKLKEKKEYAGININHFIIKGTAYALKAVPRVNCAMRDGQLYDPGQINIGIITAVEDGLLIPVIRNVPELSLQDVTFEARAAIERARAGRPSATDLSGGTFSISNMGMFDVENFTAIINPGQGGILAVSSTIDTPVVENKLVVIAPVMKVTLSVDHRIIDGVVAGEFLKALKEGLEYPALLMR